MAFLQKFTMTAYLSPECCIATKVGAVTCYVSGLWFLSLLGNSCLMFIALQTFASSWTQKQYDDKKNVSFLSAYMSVLKATQPISLFPTLHISGVKTMQWFVQEPEVLNKKQPLSAIPYVCTVRSQ